MIRMHKHQFILFYKTAHGIPVAGWNKIFIMTIDSGEIRIKLNM